MNCKFSRKMQENNMIQKIFLPLLLTNWILGMGIIEFPLGTIHPTLSLIYSSALICIYCSLACIVYPEISQQYDKIETTSVMIKIQFFSQILLTIINVVNSRYRCYVSADV